VTFARLIRASRSQCEKRGCSERLKTCTASSLNASTPSPHGFPATESGVELRLLAKIFTREEATLAAAMRLTHEPTAETAERAGVDLKWAYPILKRMTRKGLILAKKGEVKFSSG
jgi:hypothetical protein